MHIFRNRPLAMACFSFVAAALLALLMPASVQIICIIVSVLSLIVLTFFYLKKTIVTKSDYSFETLSFKILTTSSRKSARLKAKSIVASMKPALEPIS